MIGSWLIIIAGIIVLLFFCIGSLYMTIECIKDKEPLMVIVFFVVFLVSIGTLFNIIEMIINLK